MLVKMQALCYARYCFMDFVDKWPGSICDSTTFYNFKVNEMQKDGIISFMRKVVVDDVSPVPRCIGDVWETLPTVLFLPFLMKEFPVGGNTIQVQLFGWCLSSTSMAIKFSIGRSKARSNALRREMLITTDFHSGYMPLLYCITTVIK